VRAVLIGGMLPVISKRVPSKIFGIYDRFVIHRDSFE
jgi:hypothetical protein